jgi:hypothetical protein
MLTRVIHATGVVVLMTALVLIVGQQAAQADGGPGGSGGGFGNVTCGQSYSPSCRVSAGSPGSSSSGSTGRNGTGGGTLAADPAGGAGCTGTVSKAFGCVPAGCTLTAQTVACPIGAARPPGGGAPVPPPPAVLAQLAVRYLRLPDPVIRSSPAPGALQLTRLPTWLWVALAAWRPESKTARVPGESVTATATPVSASWQMGDGKTVTCHGPGTPYTAGDNPASSSPTCGYTYTRSSAGQPHAAYHVTVTITWDITWTGTGGAGGALSPLFTAAAAAMRVAESQAVNTAGGA